jgi:hypothetical protein
MAAKRQLARRYLAARTVSITNTFYFLSPQLQRA